MARSITFNGVTLFKPGGITKVNAEALNQVLLGDNAIVALLGEADGGAPGSESGLVTLFEPSRATTTFKSGPLADAIRLAFQSSGDPDILGGASRVLCWKTNQSTQAVLSLPSENASEEVSSTATGGGATTLIDTVGLAGFVDDTFNNMWVVLRPFTATTEVRRITDFADSSDTITVDAAWTVNPSAGNAYIVLQNEIELAGAVLVGSSSSTSVAVIGGGLTASAHVGRWLYIEDTAANVYLRQITANTTSAFTVSPALPATPTAGAWFEVLPNVIDLSSRDWGAHTNGITVEINEGSSSDLRQVTAGFEGDEEISNDLGGVNYLHILYKGAGVSVSDTAAALSTTTVINLTTGGLTPSAHIGQQVVVGGDEYTTITANGADTLTVSPPLSVAPDAGTAVVITALTASVARVTGSAGAATGLSTTLTGVTGDDLSITFSTGQTLRQLATVINANINYLATIPNDINPDTTLIADFDFGPDTELSLHNSFELDETAGFRQDIMAMVDYFNSFSEFLTAVRSSDAGSSVAGNGAPQAWDPSIVLGTDEPFSLAGGSRGISANTDFQAGFDAILLVRANSVVPLIDEDLTNEGNGSTATVASVAAQLVDHVAQARGAAQNIAGERGGFIGFQGTKDEVIEQANDINDYDVAMCAQNPTVLNSLGSLEEFGPRIMAVMAASMRAGAPEVGEPLTHKYLRVSGLTQDASWDPADLTDANDMIINGVLFAETIDGKGTRWVRDLTTHVKDDNLAFMEGSVRDSVRYVAFTLRDTLVERFTGKKATPFTVSNVKDAAIGVLELLRQDNIIVDSTDLATGATIRAYHNLKVTSSGDVVRLCVGVFPVPGINFQLNEIFLQLPTQSA